MKLYEQLCVDKVNNRLENSINKNILFTLMVNENKSHDEIANLFDISPIIVDNWLNLYCIVFAREI